MARIARRVDLQRSGRRRCRLATSEGQYLLRLQENAIGSRRDDSGRKSVEHPMPDAIRRSRPRCPAGGREQRLLGRSRDWRWRAGSGRNGSAYHHATGGNHVRRTRHRDHFVIRTRASSTRSARASSAPIRPSRTSRKPGSRARGSWSRTARSSSTGSRSRSPSCCADRPGRTQAGRAGSPRLLRSPPGPAAVPLQIELWPTRYCTRLGPRCWSISRTRSARSMRISSGETTGMPEPSHEPLSCAGKTDRASEILRQDRPRRRAPRVWSDELALTQTGNRQFLHPPLRGREK